MGGFCGGAWPNQVECGVGQWITSGSAGGFARAIPVCADALYGEQRTQHRDAWEGEGAGDEFNEYGLFRGEDVVKCEDEAAIYRALDLYEIPPEMREDHGEFERAVEPLATLVTREVLRGVFHAHTTDSDGSARLEEMAEACRAQGWSYLGVSDHSQSAHYANGLTVERVFAPTRRGGGIQSKVVGLCNIEGDRVGYLDGWVVGLWGGYLGAL